MMRSRRRHALCCFAAANLAVLQGCYAYAPVALMPGPGAEVRVEGQSIELHDGPAISANGSPCVARSVTGIVERTRGDTLTLQPLIDMKRVTPRGSCPNVSRVTLLAPPATTSVATPQFSGAKTTLSVIGIGVFVAVVASAFVLGSDHSARTAPSLGAGR